jgi:hypothetical protein
MATGGELAGPVQPGQSPGITTVGLDPVARSLRNERRCHDVTTHSHGAEQTLEVVAGGARFVAGPDTLRLPQPFDEATNRVAVVEDLVDFRGVPVGRQDRHSNRVLCDVHPQMDEPSMGNTGHGWLLPSVCRLRSPHK